MFGALPRSRFKRVVLERIYLELLLSIVTAQLHRFAKAEGMICILFPHGSHSGRAAINDYNDRSKFSSDLVMRPTIY